jgi:adenosylmethionine-8-amino-7-oxononanoate aminotransferase
MDPRVRRTLRALAKTRSHEEMKSLFAAIRAADDDALLQSALATASSRRASDPAAALARRLAPIVATADEKAALVIESLAETQGPIGVQPDGLTPTLRKLVARYGEPAVGAAIDALMARLAHWGSTRERVT